MFSLAPPPGPAKGIAQLRQRISVLEGTAQRFAATVPIAELIDSALPQKGLPLGCVHEIHGVRLSQAIAFASLLTGRIAPDGNVFFIAPPAQSFYPLGLLPFHIDCKNWIHVAPRRPSDRIWAVLEALRCREVAAVLGVLPPADLTVCRQLQLAAENSGATCFLVGDKTASSAASVITRWRIAPSSCAPESAFDHCSWKIDLTYCRGGSPGSWTAAHQHGELEAELAIPVMREFLRRPAARIFSTVAAGRIAV